MNKRIAPADLCGEVARLLQEYGDEVHQALSDCVEEAGKEAKDELRGVNRFSSQGHPSGAYAKDWKYQVVYPNRLAKEVVVYNAKHYGLAHLLEFGHALVRGGRTVGQVPAYPHIADVNDRAQENFIRKVESRL